MPVFPMTWAGQSSNVGANTGASLPTSITAAGSTNTKGSYTQLIASTPFLSSWLIVQAMTNTNGSTMLGDIAIGGAGSEKIIVPDLMVQGPRDLFALPLPISVPKGVRLSARVQAATASHVCYLEITLLAAQAGMINSGGIVDTYGQNTATSRGTSIDPGGSANTKGSWTQIAASTTRRARGFFLLIGGQGNTAASLGSWLYDVAIGGSGSEQTIVSNWAVDVRAAGNVHPQPHCSPFFPIPIASGARIAVRSQSTVTDATDRLHDVQIVAVA